MVFLLSVFESSALSQSGNGRDSHPRRVRDARFKALAHTSRMESSSLAREPDPGRWWSN